MTDPVQVDARPVVRGDEIQSIWSRCEAKEHARCPGPRIWAQRDKGTHVECGWDVCSCDCHGPRPLPLERRLALEELWTGALLLFLLVVPALLVVGCGGGSGWDEKQEPVTAVALTSSGNQVAFGASLADRPDLRELAIAAIDSQVRGRLPGVRFYVVHGGAVVPGRPVGRFAGYRVTGARAYVVAAWLDERDGAPTFSLPGLAFEVEHLATGTFEPFELGRGGTQ